MKKLIEIHLGHAGKNDVDANLDIYIEASETSGLYNSTRIKTMFLAQYFAVLNQTTGCDKDKVSIVLDYHVSSGENIAELFRDYFESDSVNPYENNDKIEHMKQLAFSADGELTAMGENPNVLEMADHINGTIATLCKQAEKITGKDMSYYAYTAEIDPELYRDMHPITAFHLMRDTYLKFAEILLAICKDCETEEETWF